jgi:cytoskeletal protein CcmA (bactofilin family)
MTQLIIQKLNELNANNNITIGQGVKFVGSISLRGKAFINGSVTGDLTADDIEVGQFGVVKGKTMSREMNIHGQVHEDVKCVEHVLVQATGLVTGKLAYGELEIKKGGQITGSMNHLSAGKR